MTSVALELPQPPARSGGGPIVFEPVSDALAARLGDVFGGALSVETLADARAERPEGHYRVQPADGGDAVFVRIVAAGRAAGRVAADARVGRLPDDAPVVRPREGFPRAFEARWTAFAYPFVAGGPVDPAGGGLERAGEALADLHRALRAVAPAAEIREAARERTEMMRRALVAAGKTPESTAHRIGLLVAPLDLADLDHLEAGPVHGDANPGNLIRAEADGRVLFLDFEDTLRTWAPPLFDLAMMIERLCLIAAGDERVSLGRRLLASYVRRAGRPVMDEPVDLARAVRLINLRAVALLHCMEAGGRPVPADEWQKFRLNLQRLESEGETLRAIGAAGV